MIDIKAAKNDPASVFASPLAVVETDGLNIEDKTDILRRWEYDARQLEVAEEENMTSGQPSLLAEILRALDLLDYERRDVSPPTKQGGC
jgi:hypothetical protein